MNSKSEIKIIFEDERLVVIDKPAGMVVNNAQTVHEDTVQSWFERIFNIQFSIFKDTEFAQKGGVVHRLDKETSGLLILAKDPESYEKLKSQFLNRRVNKTYLALVHGMISPDQGIISLPIIRNPKVWGKFTVGGDLAKTAVTEWKVLKHYRLNIDNFSFLELRPMTGRTHQLRVHLKHLGHPIVADPQYLGEKLLKSDLAWCPRMWLHAYKLTLVHPVSGIKLEFTSEIPQELQKAILKLVH